MRDEPLTHPAHCAHCKREHVGKLRSRPTRADDGGIEQRVIVHCRHCGGVSWWDVAALSDLSRQ